MPGDAGQEFIQIGTSRAISASLSPTIWYVFFSSVSSSTSVTVAPNLIVLPESFDTSITSARDNLSSSSAMRPSFKACASLAA